MPGALANKYFNQTTDACCFGSVSHLRQTQISKPLHISNDIIMPYLLLFQSIGNFGKDSARACAFVSLKRDSPGKAGFAWI
jgi:hypothetical protein